MTRASTATMTLCHFLLTARPGADQVQTSNTPCIIFRFSPPLCCRATSDTVDLPLPLAHTSTWTDVVRYIYTGQGPLTPAMREVITYLGGADSRRQGLE